MNERELRQQELSGDVPCPSVDIRNAELPATWPNQVVSTIAYFQVIVDDAV